MKFLITPYFKHNLLLPSCRGLLTALNEYSSTLNIKIDKQLIRWGFSPSQPKDYRPHESAHIKAEAVSDESLYEIIDKYKEIDSIPLDISDHARRAFLDNYTRNLPNTFGKSNMVYLKETPLTENIKTQIQSLINTNKKIEAQTGAFWYPDNGYMSWHTNENHTGFRIYCAYSFKEKSSYFKYRDPETKEIVTCWDDFGWNVRVFKVGRTPKDRLWHCVHSDTDRISIGFSVEE